MYGFFRVSTDRLDDHYRKIYNQFYCGQCHALSRFFGYKWRTLVSYDATFFGLLISAQQISSDNKSKAWCGLFPKKVSICSPEETSQVFSACFAITIFSIKLSDSLQDRNSISKKIFSYICQPVFKKAENLLETINFPVQLLNKTLQDQQNIEQHPTLPIENYAEPSAKFFAEMFQFTARIAGAQENEMVLYEIGYHLGKVIYLTDSFVDILDDIQKNEFNAFLSAYQKIDGGFTNYSRTNLVNTVMNSLTTIRALTKNLKIKRHQPLIKNTLLIGFSQNIQHKIQSSIKELRKKNRRLLKYLPHAALASALCLFTADNAAAEAWVWGKEVNPVYSDKFIAYGYLVCENPKECPLCYSIETVLNPCLCKIHKPGHCCCILIQLPKMIVWYFPLAFFFGFVMAIGESIEIKKQKKMADQKQKEEAFLNELNSDLFALEDSINKLCEQLECSFPVHYQDPINEFVSGHHKINLSKNSELQNIVLEQTNRAKRDLDKLQTAFNLYMEIFNFYLEVARTVNRTGSIPLIKNMEVLYSYLVSSNLKSLLPQRQWEDFQNFVSDIHQDLIQIKQVAIQYQQYEYEEYEECEKEKDVFDYKSEMTESKAYYILGVPPSIKDDDLKSIYRKLAKIYAPDKGLVKDHDENRMKELTTAYNCLKQIRKFK